MTRPGLRALLLLAILAAAGGGGRPPHRAGAAPAVPFPPAGPRLSPASWTAPAAAAAPPLAPRAPAPPPARPGAGRRLHHAGMAPPGADDESRARAVLAREARRLGLDGAPGRLERTASFRSPVGSHVRFRQVVEGIPVEGSEVSVHAAPDGRILVVNADLFDVPSGPPAPLLDAAAAAAAAAALLGEPGEEEPEVSAPALAWLPRGRTARLVYAATARCGDESLRVFVDAATGDVLGTEDLRRAAEGSGQVFTPNPVWWMKDASLRDFADADSQGLHAALVTVPLPRLDGSGFLRGTWVDLTPTRPRAFEPTLQFHYTRSDPRFEQVNAYHHLDALQQYVHGDLGYGSGPGVLRVDAHHGSMDNSFFDLANGRIYFGDGGVDDAEDGDIVAHEYGHALQEALRPGFGRSRDAATMGEGFGDWLAASRRSSGDETWDAAVGSWDATSFSSGFPPALRRVDGDGVYPGDLRGEVHVDGEIWSSALREIRRRIGAADADRVIVGSHLLLTSRATFAEGAAAVVAANLSLRGGADEGDLRGAFALRGIPVGDDTLEEDDSPAAATPVDRALFEGMYAADDDWFLLRAAPGAGVAFGASPGVPGARPALALFDGSLRLIAESPRFSTAPSVATGPVAAAAPFYLRVSPGVGGPGPYDLFLSGEYAAPAPDPFEPNDAPETAVPLPTGAKARIHLAAGEEDWFLLEGTQDALVEIEAAFDGGSVDVDLALFAPDGTLLEEAATAGSPESLSLLVEGVDAPRVLLRATAVSGSGTADLLAFVRPSSPDLGRRAVKGVLAPAREREFPLPVDLAPGHLARVRVAARKFGPGGVPAEIEVISPSGIVVVPYGAGATPAGATVEFEAPEPGEWRVRLRSPDGSGGGFRLKARVRR